MYCLDKDGSLMSHGTHALNHIKVIFDPYNFNFLHTYSYHCIIRIHYESFLFMTDQTENNRDRTVVAVARQVPAEV